MHIWIWDHFTVFEQISTFFLSFSVFVSECSVDMFLCLFIDWKKSFFPSIDRKIITNTLSNIINHSYVLLVYMIMLVWYHSPSICKSLSYLISTVKALFVRVCSYVSWSNEFLTVNQFHPPCISFIQIIFLCYQACSLYSQGVTLGVITGGRKGNSTTHDTKSI